MSQPGTLMIEGKTKKRVKGLHKGASQGDPENEVLDVLQISFDGSKETEKKIFLDIACFCEGKYRDYVKKILKYCDFDPIIEIVGPIEKSLLTVDDFSRLWMHE
ncbi:hypothetical protein WN943_015479 [Citrus x changshan-huyou]